MISVPVFFSFGRSGGTLVNQLLGTHPDYLVLSEVNPAACSKPLTDQAVEWLLLVEPEEADGFAQLAYAEQISELQKRATERQRRLIVRDWTSVNFISGCSPNVMPSAVLEQAVYLRLAGICFVPLVIVRRGLPVYLSFRRNFEQFASADLDSFSQQYLQYAKAVAHYPFIHLERLREDPRRAVSEILRTFEMPDEHVDRMLLQFHDFHRCTGNNTLRRQTESSMATTVLRSDTAPNLPDYARLALKFEEADRLLGYD